LACKRREDGSHECLADHVSLFVDEEEAERFVFDDRPAKTHAILIAALVILWNAVKVVEPFAGVERRVTIRPECAAAVLIGSPAGHPLYLSGTSDERSVPRRGEDADLPAQDRRRG